MQEEWTRVLQPAAAMLKFRLPYDVKRFPRVDYLDGQVKKEKGLRWPIPMCMHEWLPRTACLRTDPHFDFVSGLGVMSGLAACLSVKQIYLPIWGPRTTTETRLIATDPESLKSWDCLDYESALFHFNTVTRTRYFEHDQKAEGYDHCYDCAAEALVLGDYLFRRHGITHPEVLTLAVDRLSEMLSTHIGSTRKSLKISGIDKL